MGLLAATYNKGGETAQIGCTIRYDMPKVGQKSYIRMDREEVVEVHDMSLEEKPGDLAIPTGHNRRRRTAASAKTKTKRQNEHASARRACTHSGTDE